MLFADLLSLHLVTFLMLLFLFMSLFFSSRCMLELKFAIYYTAASLPSQASYAVLAEESQAFFKHSPHTNSIWKKIARFSMGVNVWQLNKYMIKRSTSCHARDDQFKSFPLENINLGSESCRLWRDYPARVQSAGSKSTRAAVRWIFYDVCKQWHHV